MSLPLDDTGLTWPDIVAIRDRYARRWFYHCGQVIPLQEFQSYGNVVITRLLHRYTPTCGVPFAACLHADLRRKLARVWAYEYAGFLAHTRRDTQKRRTWEGDSPFVFGRIPDVPTPPRQEDLVMLHQMDTFLEDRAAEEERRLLWASLDTTLDRTASGLTPKAYRYRLGKLKRLLLAWATKGPDPHQPVAGSDTKGMSMTRLTAVVLMALTLGALGSVPVALASNIVGTAVTIGGLDDLTATADTHARKGVGKVIAMVLGMGGAALVLSGKVGLGLSGVGAGIGMGFMPGIMSTAFDAAPAATFDVVTQSSL
jgi:hypothetical protein